MAFNRCKNLYTYFTYVLMGIKTSLTKASGKSDSLRTTVPMSIVKQFELNEGDILSWILKIRGNRLIIEVNPIKKEEEQ